MLKLIKLEWKKNNIKRYFCSATIITVLLLVFIFALAFLGIAEDPDGTLDAAAGNGAISAPIELFTSIAFLVLTSVMLASFIVSSYTNKTMNLMFSYPIKRQKILISQMLSVWIFSFAALTIAKLLTYVVVMIASRYMTSSFEIDFNMLNISFYVELLVKSVFIVSMSFIALFVGLVRKSAKSTIVSSFLLILLTQANVGGLTFAKNWICPIVLTAASLCFALLSIRDVETKDLM